MTRRHNGRPMRGRVTNRLDHAPEPDIDQFPGDKERCSESRKKRIEDHAKRVQSHREFVEYNVPIETCAGRAKLSPDDVRAIRIEGAEYGTLPLGENTPLAGRIAKKYGVGVSAIRGVLLGLTWTKVK